MTRTFLVTNEGGVQFVASIRDGLFYRFQPGVGFMSCNPAPLKTVEDFLEIKEGGMRVGLREDKEAMQCCIRSLSEKEADLFAAAMTDMQYSIYSNFANAYTAATHNNVYPPCAYIQELSTRIFLLCHYFENEVGTPLTNIVAALTPELAQSYAYVKNELKLITPDFDYTPREGFPVSLATMLLHYAEMRYIYTEGNLEASQRDKLLDTMKTIEKGIPCISKMISDAFTVSSCDDSELVTDANMK